MDCPDLTIPGWCYGDTETAAAKRTTCWSVRLASGPQRSNDAGSMSWRQAGQSTVAAAPGRVRSTMTDYGRASRVSNDR
jgi:hypothetical protein